MSKRIFACLMALCLPAAALASTCQSTLLGASEYITGDVQSVGSNVGLYWYDNSTGISTFIYSYYDPNAYSQALATPGTVLQSVGSFATGSDDGGGGGHNQPNSTSRSVVGNGERVPADLSLLSTPTMPCTTVTGTPPSTLPRWLSGGFFLRILDTVVVGSGRGANARGILGTYEFPHTIPGVAQCSGDSVSRELQATQLYNVTYNPLHSCGADHARIGQHFQVQFSGQFGATGGVYIRTDSNCAASHKFSEVVPPSC
jgi:hypothetical protein